MPAHQERAPGTGPLTRPDPSPPSAADRAPQPGPSPAHGGPLPDGPLEGIELVRLRLSLTEPWVTSLGTIRDRDVLLVRVVVDGSSGWGECVAQPEPTYSAEYVDGAADVLRRHLLPRALRAGGADDLAIRLAEVKGHPMARAAIEVADLDARLRITGTPLAVHLAGRCDPPAGEPPTTVPAGVAIGVTGDIGALVEEVDRRVEQGYGRVKLKIHPGWDTVPVAAVRARWGPDDLAVQVDANGSYAGVGDSAGALRALDGAALVLIEQPLGDDDLLGHARLAASLRTPICLDESITSLAVASTALAVGACRVVNLKVGRVGGTAEAVRIHDLCRRSAIAVWCGGMLETGIGRATNLALASLPGFTLPGDLSAADRFWAEDIVTQPARLEPGGRIGVPTGPGLGVTLRSDLASVMVRRDWYPAV